MRPEADAGHDMVEAAHAGGEPTQTIEATAALARVDGLAESAGGEEVGILERDGERDPGADASRTNLLGEAHFDDVASQAALQKT